MKTKLKEVQKQQQKDNLGQNILAQIKKINKNINWNKTNINNSIL